MTYHQLLSSDFQSLLNMQTTACMQQFQAAQPQRALHPDLTSQDLFHNLQFTNNLFLIEDFVLLPYSGQEALSPQVLARDLNSDNASVTPHMLPELLDIHGSGGSPSTIAQMMSAVSTPSRIVQQDLAPDASEVDDINAMNDCPFMCLHVDEQLCTDAFKTLEELKQHEATAHSVHSAEPIQTRSPASSIDERPVGRFDPLRNMTVFDCMFAGCSKAYTTRNRVKVHSRSHTGSKPYKCPNPDCCYAATQKSSVSTHMLTHLPAEVKSERKLAKKGTIECAACLKKYKTLKTLGSHKCRGGRR
ncbi:hypothetical protein HDU81_007550 [Chytriomyces hyalinus]|nr:hypothetical protein HDU81_007550 [Chytriomyces hyalinus]